MELRIARPEEYGPVGELTLRCYVGGGFTSPDSPYVAQLVDAARRAREAELVVAVEDGRLLGAVTFARPDSPYAEVGEPEEAGFRMLVVDPTARQHGVGTALVTWCIERASSLGYRRLRLSTQLEMTTAHRLYHRLGFYRTPQRDWEPLPGLTLITYAMDLPAMHPARADLAGRRAERPSR